jgi:cell division protein FtsL
MGIAEETVKSVSAAVAGTVEAMKSTPLVLALCLMNIALLVFFWYYISRVLTRTESTAQLFYQNQQAQNASWNEVLKGQNSITEKTIHCILPEDAVKIFSAGQSRIAPLIARPDAPERPQ